MSGCKGVPPTPSFEKLCRNSSRTARETQRQGEAPRIAPLQFQTETLPNIQPISPTVQTGTDVQGNPIYAPKSGYCLIATPDVLVNTPAAAADQVHAPLDGVWAGDDPANPMKTVEICFADQATAQSVLAAYWTADAMS